jgi:hypothetical protein
VSRLKLCKGNVWTCVNLSNFPNFPILSTSTIGSVDYFRTHSYCHYEGIYRLVNSATVQIFYSYLWLPLLLGYLINKCISWAISSNKLALILSWLYQPSAVRGCICIQGNGHHKW